MEEDKKRCGCGCYLSQEEELQEYGYETYYTCNNPRCSTNGIRTI